MRGNFWSQVKHLVRFTHIFQPNTSKHAAKIIIIPRFKKLCLEQGFSPSSRLIWHHLGRTMAIYSFSTWISYTKKWRQVLDYSWRHHGVRDIEKLTAEIAQDFLQSMIMAKVARSSFDAYASALVKLQLALNIYSRKRGTNIIYDFGLDPNCNIRKMAASELREDIRSRAYLRPTELVASLPDRWQIIAEVQYQAGPRVSEVLTLRTTNLIGYNCVVLVNTKGGLERTIMLSEKTYQKLLAFLEANGASMLLPGQTVESASNIYRRQLQKAAIQTEQTYEGSHGLRWCYARESYNRYIRQGMTPEQAAAKVSADLGHRRASITAHYLR